MQIAMINGFRTAQDPEDFPAVGDTGVIASEMSPRDEPWCTVRVHWDRDTPASDEGIPSDSFGFPLTILGAVVTTESAHLKTAGERQTNRMKTLRGKKVNSVNRKLKKLSRHSGYLDQIWQHR